MRLLPILLLLSFVLSTPAGATERRVDLTASFGWNVPEGSGLSVGYRVRPAVSVFVGAGLGASGTRWSLGGRYWFTPSSGDSGWLGLNYALVPGTGNQTLTVELPDDANNPVQRDLRFETGHLVYATIGHRWSSTSGLVHFDLFTGLGMRLAGGRFVVADDKPLSDVAKLSLSFVEPGGLVAGLRFGLSF